MKQCIKIFVALFCLLHYVDDVSAQDVGFSQFYDQPFLRNPALSGIFTGDIRFVASYRNQWQSVTVPYRTFGLSAEVKYPLNLVHDDNLTAGMQVYRDVAGTSEFSTTQILPALNYSFPLNPYNNSFLSLGFIFGLKQQRFDPTKLVLNDQFVQGSNGTFTVLPSSAQVFDNTSVNYFDLSGGVSYYRTIGEAISCYAGLGMYHLKSPKVGFFDGNKIMLNRKMTFNFGLTDSLNEISQLTFYGDYYQQLDSSFKGVGKGTLQAGIIYGHDIFVYNDNNQSINFGLLYRWDDALIPVIQLELSQFVIGVSYDINVSKLVVASQSRGGLELTLSYKDFFASRKYDPVKCPLNFGRRHSPKQYLNY